MIREPRDRRSFDSSPGLFAAFHALHRLPAPRHPPHALSNLATWIHAPRHGPDPERSAPGPRDAAPRDATAKAAAPRYGKTFLTRTKTMPPSTPPPKGPHLRPHLRSRQRCHSERSDCQRSNGTKASRPERRPKPLGFGPTQHAAAPAGNRRLASLASVHREGNGICHGAKSQPARSIFPPHPGPQTPAESTLAARIRRPSGKEWYGPPRRRSTPRTGQKVPPFE